MDAVKFINERSRMCKNIKCSECDLSSNNTNLNPACDIFIWKHPDKAVEVVEKWSKEHSVRTRQSEFLKHYPNATVNESTGAIVLCPVQVFGSERDICNETGAVSCDNCCKNFWLAPAVEEDG